MPRLQKSVEELEQEEENIKYLEKEQLAKFLETAKEKGMPGDYVIFLLLAYTGMRAGELCALKWKDVNMKENTISIPKTYYNPSNRTKEYQLLPPKTLTSRRVIEVDSTVIKELKKHKAAQSEVKFRNQDIWHDKDFVLGKHQENT